MNFNRPIWIAIASTLLGFNSISIAGQLVIIGSPDKAHHGMSYGSVIGVTNDGVAAGYQQASGTNFSGIRSVRYGPTSADATVLDDLGTTAVGHTYALSAAMNEAGFSVGFAYKNGVSSDRRAVRWDALGSSVIELEVLSTNSLGKANTEALDINNSNIAVGFAVKYVDGVDVGERPIKWNEQGEVIELGILGTSGSGTTNGRAQVINQSGQIFGHLSRYDGMLGTWPVRWDPNTTEPVVLGDRRASWISDASDTGFAVGSSDSGKLRWSPSGTVTVLDGLGGATNSDLSINDGGTAVGYGGLIVDGQSLGTRAVRWDAGTSEPTQLQNLGTDAAGKTDSCAYDLNEASTVVGYAADYSVEPPAVHAVIWKPDGSVIKLVDLNLVADEFGGVWKLDRAKAISPDGWVAGEGQFDPDGSGPLPNSARHWVAQVGLGGDWLNTTNTDNAWGRGRNWSTGTPAIQLDAKFNFNASYHVAFDDDESARNVIVSAGDVTFDLAGNQKVVVDQTLTLSNASLRVADGSLTTAAMEIESATLDLGNAKLVVDYFNPSPFASIKNWIINHSITSDLESGQAIGLAEASALFGVAGGDWLGDAVDGSSILVIKTLAGDANLDLHVNFNDLLTIAQNYGQSNQEWTDGDSNFDGVVNFNDLLFVAQNYNDSMSSVGALDFSSSFWMDWSLARSMVPEPGAIALVGLIGLTMLRRQRA